MHGDFSLNPLAFRDNVSRVLYQQGRVQLDSDVNESTEALLRAARGATSDIIGPHGGLEDSFKIIPPAGGQDDFLIQWGQYYVDGIRCVNLPPGDFWDIVAKPPSPLLAGVPYRKQPWLIRKPEPQQEDLEPGLLYLDVFEHPVSSAQDESLREVALLGADTSSRAIVVWQVRKLTEQDTGNWKHVIPPPPIPPYLPSTVYDIAYLRLNLFLRSGGRLAARATLNETTDPCVISPDARYRGLDNRLFRVEIHQGGRFDTAGGNKPTFKFSRDNGAEVYPIRDIQGKVVQLESLGRDHRTAIRVNDWVEVVDDEVLLMNKVNTKLSQVVAVNRHDMSVTLDEEPAAGKKQELRPMLRRWDGPPVEIKLGTSDPEENWFDLADGIQVQFTYEQKFQGGFRTGDYWLIPARTATGDVMWPRDANKNPIARGPHGVEHHYAPLLDTTVSAGSDLRRKFKVLAPVLP
jgi:hypothetical protein